MKKYSVIFLPFVIFVGTLVVIHLTTSVFLFTPKSQYDRLENKVDVAIERSDWHRALNLCNKLLALIASDRDKGRVTNEEAGVAWHKTMLHTKYALVLTGELLENFFAYSSYHGFGEMIPEQKSEFFLLPSAYRFFSEIELHTLAMASVFNRFDNFEKPADLINFIESSLIVGDYRTLKTMVNRLEKDGNRKQRRQAQKYRTLLADTAAINADPYFIARRELGPKNDFLVCWDFDLSVLNLHFSNPNNQRAFEYALLIALLNNDFDYFFQIENLLEQFDYNHIPRHLEEAILIFSNYGDNPEISRSMMMRQLFGGLTIRQETILRHEQMTRDLQKLQHGQISEQRFINTYQDTYQLHFLLTSGQQ